jgi:hypothetical protein
MIDHDEQELFESTKQRVADVVSMLVDDGPHPALIFAAMMSAISEAITTERFWGAETPDFTHLQGYLNLMWMLQAKAFSDLAVARLR